MKQSELSMINIIKNIFNLFNYQKLTSSDLNLFKSKDMDDYWLIYEGEPKQLLEHKIQSELIAQCKRECSNSALEKNINLICLWKIGEANKNTISELQQVEEDIYFFKKHVLYFKGTELERFNSEISTRSLNEILLDSTTDPSVFNQYKTNTDKALWESLLYRICIKLSFIPIAKGASEEISNLHQKHELSFNKKRNKTHLLNLESIILKLNDEQINSEPKELLKTITSKLEGNSNEL